MSTFPAGRLIWSSKRISGPKKSSKINPILRGWANFHRHVCSKKTYQWVDHIVFGILWKWAKRRHPNKGARWVKDRHFQRIGSRKWEFSSDGTTKHCLYTTASTTIRRHVKTKGQANPFHPDWDPYFAKRKQTAKIRRELDTYLGGTIGKQCVRGRLPALEGPGLRDGPSPVRRGGSSAISPRLERRGFPRDWMKRASMSQRNIN